MSNLEKYKNAFVEGLEVDLSEVEGLSMENCDKGESIGQMSLIAVLEDAFEIELDPEEVMAFTSYEAGIEILKNHQIDL